MGFSIRGEGLAKRYVLGQRQQHAGLRDAITSALSAPWRRWRRTDAAEPAAESIWALRDASFEIQQGEIVGLVGRNGSGKSTLLKILSRITEPTAGSATVRGRVGSLLEVGTGFHHELTGRENVFVNGAILGMRRAEISRKFDAIVAFADVEKFIDTPVKFYSSGMQMRLAFSVAAHLEPEILLVDEVLAVGDAAFQKKCLGKMDEVSHDGRTIIFVSHQMNQIRRLCSKTIWLDEGRVVACGDTRAVLTKYEASFMTPGASDQSPLDGRRAAFTGWTVKRGGSDGPRHQIDDFTPQTVAFTLRLNMELVDGHHGVALFDADGRVVWGTGTDNLRLGPGLYEIVYTLPLQLKPGPYRWQVSIFEQGQFVDGGDLSPEMAVETPPLGHRRDDYAGFLNLPYAMRISRLEGSRPARAIEVFRRTAGDTLDEQSSPLAS